MKYFETVDKIHPICNIKGHIKKKCLDLLLCIYVNNGDCQLLQENTLYLAKTNKLLTTS